MKWGKEETGGYLNKLAKFDNICIILKMSEIKETPTKSYHRFKDKKLKEQCRLCDSNTNQLQKIFSEKGIEKNLKEKINKCCGGIIVTEHDELSTSLCRSCETFVIKISRYQDNCQKFEKSNLVKKRCMNESDNDKEETAVIKGFSHKSLRYSDPGPSQSKKKTISFNLIKRKCMR